MSARNMVFHQVSDNLSESVLQRHSVLQRACSMTSQPTWYLDVTGADACVAG